MQGLLYRCILGLGVFFAAASATAQSDVVDGPLIRPAVSIQIIQTAGETIIVHEVAHNIRHIYMDQAHPHTVNPSFMGDSAGQWEGDTLVVDTIGLNDRTWIDEVGVIHGKQLHVIERIRKIEGGHALENLIRIEDPEYFTEAWYARITYAWRPDLRLTEYICEENNRNMPTAGHTAEK